MQQVTNATADFRREFVISIARTPEQVREAFRLRHQVYCLERGFEATTPAGIEQDEFDRQAHHVIASDRRTGQIVGTVRLLLPTPGVPGRDSMPIRRLCAPSLLRDLPYATTAEVSRFAISKERRDTMSGCAGLLRLGLVQGGVRLSRDLGLTHWCAVMERSLLRLMRSTAIRFNPIGPMVEYHGLRQPCAAHIGSVLAEMADEQPALWDLVTEGGSLWWNEPQLAAA